MVLVPTLDLALCLRGVERSIELEKEESIKCPPLPPPELAGCRNHGSDLFLISLSLSLALVLTACGGGGGGTASKPPANPATVSGTYADTAPLSVSVNIQDYSTSPRTSQNDINKVSAVTSDGSGGYMITYMIDGVSRSVSLGSADRSTDYYSRRDGAIDHYFDVNDYNFADPNDEYDHVNLSWLYRTVYPDAESSSPLSQTIHTVVHGEKTAPSGMPTTGRATYGGNFHVATFEPRPASGEFERASTNYRGDLMLSADFATGTVSGTFDGRDRRLPTDDGYVEFSSQFALNDGSISGNGLTADFSGLGYDGTVNGAFYGPDAAEVGGVMDATHENGNILMGMFRGNR